MQFDTEYSTAPYPGYKPPVHQQARLLLGTVYAASLGVIEHLDAQVVFAVGLGYARNWFPEGYALQSPETYIEQKVPPPYGPPGQPVSADTGAG